MRGPYGWIKCPTCKPSQTNAQARQAALFRLDDCIYRYAQNGRTTVEAVILAWQACRKAGASRNQCGAVALKHLTFDQATELGDMAEPPIIDSQLQLKVSE